MKEYKYYIPVKENETGKKELRVSVYYDKGGINYWNYNVEKRGYYISVAPLRGHAVFASGRVMESYIMGEGIKTLVREASRYSDKTMDAVYQESKAEIERLTEYVCNQYGLEIDEEKRQDVA